MDLLLNLPDDLIEYIFTFWNPYIPQYKTALIELRAHYFWFNFFSFFFPRRDKEFYKYILRRNRKS
jgi:hypothetical protein